MRGRLDLAAFAAGFGGLLFEVVAVRRIGLALGNTAGAASAVLGVFLVALGIGGLTLPFTGVGARRPTRVAAGAYAAVAVAIVGAGIVLTALPTVPNAFAGWALAAAVVGVPALAMGAAFPLLFAGVVEAGVAGRRLAANLLGSVVAVWLGGNLLIPEVGLTASQLTAAAAYAVAAAVTLTVGDPLPATGEAATRAAAGPRARVALPGAVAVTVGGAGALVLGYEILLLRRLPFWLEGFQPTLTGVLAACLVALTLGAAIGPWLLRRVDATAAVVGLGVAAALVVWLRLHEVVGPELSRTPVASTAGMHARVLATALLAAGPACLLLGAIPPLALRAAVERGAPTARSAAWLFLVQGLGGLVGAVLVGHVLPALAPVAYFALVPLVLGLLGLVPWALRPAGASRRVARFVGIAIGAILVGIAPGIGADGGSVRDPSWPVRGSRYDRSTYRPLAHGSDAIVTASVAHDRRNHSMVLFTNEFRAAYTGPGTSYMQVLGHLPFVLAGGLRDVCVIALGTGTTARAVAAWPDAEVLDVVEISPAVLGLAPWFDGDGPAVDPAAGPPEFLTDDRTRVHVADGRRWLATRAAESLDLLTMEPLLPYAPGTAPLYSAEFYALARAALRPAGMLVQWVPTHAMPRDVFATLLATFAAAFDHTSVWLVDDSTLLVGSRLPHLDDFEIVRRRLAVAPPIARRTLHEAGLASGDDFRAALVCAELDAAHPILAGASILRDDRPTLERLEYWSGERKLGFLAENVAQLVELARAAPSAAAAWTDPVWASIREQRLDARRELALAVLDAAAASRAVRGLGAARVGAGARSTLLHAEQRRALRTLLETRMWSEPPEVAIRLASGHPARDPRSALLHAVAAMRPDLDDVARDDELLAALAIDPTLFDRPVPAVLSRRPTAVVRSPLEDVARLPSGLGLAAWAAGTDPRGAAVRAAYPVRCALALVACAAERPLSAAEAAAFAIVADPASLAAFAAAVRERVGGGRSLVDEIVPVWRSDLAMPAELLALGRSAIASVEIRRSLVAGLAGRRDVESIELIARYLEDDELVVREAAAGALFRSFGRRIPYDPEGSESERSAAARAVRALHNRGR